MAVSYVSYDADPGAQSSFSATVTLSGANQCLIGIWNGRDEQPTACTLGGSSVSAKYNYEVSEGHEIYVYVKTAPSSGAGSLTLGTTDRGIWTVILLNGVIQNDNSVLVQNSGEVEDATGGGGTDITLSSLNSGNLWLSSVMCRFFNNDSVGSPTFDTPEFTEINNGQASGASEYSIKAWNFYKAISASTYSQTITADLEPLHGFGFEIRQATSGGGVMIFS